MKSVIGTMKTKGVAVLSIPEFVRTKYPARFREWLDALPEPSRRIMENPILSSSWYPLRDAVIEPTRVICEMFFASSPKGAREGGRFSADLALKGVYKAFVNPGGPLNMVDRATGIFGTYFKPSKITVHEKSPNRAVIRLWEFGEPHQLVEQRMAGWMERALELIGCANVRVSIAKSMATGDSVTEFVGEWD